MRKNPCLGQLRQTLGYEDYYGTMAYKKAPLWDSHHQNHQPKSQMDWDSFLWLKN